MTAALPPDREALSDRFDLPCGCTVGKYQDAFVCYPCSTTCTYYQYVLEETARQSKPIHFNTDVDND